MNTHVLADLHFRHDDRFRDDAAFADFDAVEQDGTIDFAVDGAAFVNHAVLELGVRGDVLRGLVRVPRVDAPFRIVQVQFRIVVEQVHVRFPQARDRAHVAPVALERIRVQRQVIGQHLRYDVFAEVVRGFGIRLVDVFCQVFAQHVPFENVDAHRSQRAFRLLRFFVEFVNFQIFVGIDHAEARRFFQSHVNDGNGAVRAFFLMVVEQLRVIHLVHVIARQDQQMLRVVLVDKLQVPRDGIGRSPVPAASVFAFVRRQDEHAPVFAVHVPVASDPYVRMQHERFVLGQHAYSVDTGIRAVAKREVDDAVRSSKVYGRLCQRLRQAFQSLALSAGQQHGDHFFFLHSDEPPRQYIRLCAWRSILRRCVSARTGGCDLPG